MSQFKFNTNFWVGLLVMFAVLIGLFYIARGVFTLLAWVAPVLLIITLIIRHQVVVSYGKMLWNLLKKNPLMGIVGVVLTIVGFPVVAFALFGKALLDRKVGQITDRAERAYQDEFTEYEEVDGEEPLELPDMEKEQKSRYDDMISD